LSGLGVRIPVASAAFFVGAFALTGVPPLACFWSKMYMLAGALQIKGAFGPLVLIFVLVESLISFAWFLWVGQKVFFGKPQAQDSDVLVATAEDEEKILEPAPIADPPRSMEWILGLMIVLTLAVPLVGIPIVSSLLVK